VKSGIAAATEIGSSNRPLIARGALTSVLVAPLAQMRTDLDRFAPEEADLLSYHAYWSAHARLGSLHPELALARPAWTEYSSLTPQEVERLRRLLVRGASRLRLPPRPG
jgi:hypothetical protein